MSSPSIVRVTAITVSAESPKAAKCLESIQVQIDGRPYQPILDMGGSLCHRFQDPLELSSQSHVAISYRKSRFLCKKTRTLNVQCLFASAPESQIPGLSVVQDDIRVQFSCYAPLEYTTSSASYSSDTLVPTTQTMLKDCPQFRILIMGKSGVGKSNLINTVFGIETARVSDFHRGEADIDVGLTSPVNKRFILHDSIGIEPGDDVKYQTVRNFIQHRRNGPQADQLHAIWFCIQTPCAGGRHLEAGAEDFFKNKQQTLGSIPLIVVYTKLDLLVNSIVLKPSSYDVDDDENIDKNARLKAESTVQEMHSRVTQLTGDSKPTPYATVAAQEDYKDTLQHLIDLTHRAVGISDTNEAHVASLLADMAQRINLLLKIQGSIDVGGQKYWKALGSSPDSARHTMWNRLSVIHVDIVAVWNFNDPNSHLLNNHFKQLVIGMVEEARTASAADPIAVSEASLAAPNEKDMKQTFMTFIVNLTYVMETLFILCAGVHSKLTRRAIKLAYQTYRDSGVMAQVRARIMTYHDVDGRDAPLEKIELLIRPERDGSAYVKALYAAVDKLDLPKLDLYRTPDEDW